MRYLKTKKLSLSGAHVRDYHLLLAEHGDQLFAMTDPVAERARKIGGTTLRSIGLPSEHRQPTPADVYFGRGQTILIERERIKQQTIANRRLLHQRQAA